MIDRKEHEHHGLIFPCSPWKECTQVHPRKALNINLDFIALLIHFKHKFHNLYGEPITFNVNLEGVEMIYQALQHDQWKCKAMDINVASPTN